MGEEVFFEKLRKCDCIFIYGAGMVGGLVYERLKAASYLTQFIGFVVSTKEKEQMYYGKPVYEIGELREYRKSATVIIATMPVLQEEIFKTLSEHQFQNVIHIDELLYRSMEQQYIRSFVASHPIRQEKIDILFMASDNNCSSGAFLCMADLNQGLNKRGFSTLVVLPEYGNGESILANMGIEYTYILSEHWAIPCENPELQEKEAALAENDNAIKAIERLIDAHHVRLVHNNTTYTYVGAISAYKKNIPVVWHLRENIYAQGFQFMNSENAILTINRSARILFVSEYLKSCVKNLDSGRVQVVYDGIDVDHYYRKRDIFVNASGFTIVVVGAVIPLKGQEELLYAAHILKERKIKNFRILFIGNGDKAYFDKLKYIIMELDLTAHVDFLGRQDNVMEFYEMADIAVVCSKAEAFGRTTIEAQTAGCLVIGADIGATSELIQDGKTGFLYQQGDSKELADKIMYAVGHPKLSREIACGGQRQAYRNYSKEHNTEQIIDIYRDILEKEID